MCYDQNIVDLTSMYFFFVTGPSVSNEESILQSIIPLLINESVSIIIIFSALE